METIPIATLSPPAWVLHWDGQGESDFSVSFSHCEGQSHKTVSQNHNVLRAWEANRSGGIEPRPFSLPAKRLTARPTPAQHGHSVPSVYMSVSTDHKILTAWEERGEPKRNRTEVPLLTTPLPRLTALPLAGSRRSDQFSWSSTSEKPRTALLKAQ